MRVAEAIREAKSTRRSPRERRYHEAKLNQTGWTVASAQLEKLVQTAKIVERPDRCRRYRQFWIASKALGQRIRRRADRKIVGSFEAGP